MWHWEHGTVSGRNSQRNSGGLFAHVNHVWDETQIMGNDFWGLLQDSGDVLGRVFGDCIQCPVRCVTDRRFCFSTDLMIFAKLCIIIVFKSIVIEIGLVN